MSTDINVAAIRKRAWHYLTPEVAACAGLTLAQLQQFVAGVYRPTDAQLHALALRLQLYEPAS